MREKANYRDNLVYLSEMFGGKMILTAKEVADKFQCDVRTAKKKYPFEKGKIEITKLASKIS